MKIAKFSEKSNFNAHAAKYENKQVLKSIDLFENVDDNDFNIKDSELVINNGTLYLCYPLETLVEVPVTCKTLHELINIIREAYTQIYKNPSKYKIWGHWISDLCIEQIIIYENNLIEVSIGS